MTRREFIPVAASVAADASFGQDMRGPTLEANACQVNLDSSGSLASFQAERLDLLNGRLGASHPRVVYLGKAINTCDTPRNRMRQGQAQVFEYGFQDPYPLEVRWEVELLDLGSRATALKQKIVLRSSRPIREQIMVQLPHNIQLPFSSRQVFLPMKNGVGRLKEVRGLDNEDDYVFELSGSCGSARPQMLAIPMVHESSTQSDVRLTHCTDPLFTSLIRLPFGELAGQIHWIYPASVGLPAGEEERTVYTIVHHGGPEEAIDLFYRTALADVKPGPDWLHDVAMVDFDYLSKNGHGWFADINRLTGLIAPADRPKIVLALHGWYDLIGKYTFLPKTGSLEKEWTAFPAARSALVQSWGRGPDAGSLPTLLETPGYGWPRNSVEALQPVPMSIEEMHRRIRFAKDRGFRVVLYFADGLNACDALKDIYDPAKVLNWGGWEGPDTMGKVYAQNPIHPEVRRFYTGYIHALLGEYGKELDGFVWDETYTVAPGAIGSPATPGFADRALMTLMKEVAGAVAAYPGLAFLSSDNIGYRKDIHNAPYCLMAHGTYQDSQFRPEAWPYAIFPNFRNTFWSCNWAPVSNFDCMKFGVENFDVPVAISNGSFGDDIGVSEMTGPQLKRVMDLFAVRKSKRMRIGWIEERNAPPLYRSRPIENRYNIL